MSEHDAESGPEKSRVSVAENAKGGVQPKVTAIEGVTEEEMTRLVDIAVRSYWAARRMLDHGPTPVS